MVNRTGPRRSCPARPSTGGASPPRSPNPATTTTSSPWSLATARAAADAWSGTVVVPGADDVILQSDAVVMGGEGHDARVIGVTGDVISFAADPNLLPGNVIVAGASDGAPAGFLRRVAAIDVVNGVWVVTTVPAVLTEVFLQADYSAAQGMAHEADEYTVEPGDPDVGEITEIQTLPIDELDLAALPEESELVAADDEEIGSLAPRRSHRPVVRSRRRRHGPNGAPRAGAADPRHPGRGEAAVAQVAAVAAVPSRARHWATASSTPSRTKAPRPESTTNSR